MEVVEEQGQAVEQKQGQVKITVCMSLSGIAEEVSRFMTNS